MRVVCFFFLLLIASGFGMPAFYINFYPQDYFRSPVDHKILLSGTFGELRPNHLHAGIDIKAKNGKVGQPLYSCADGYVSRVKVQTGSYGNVLYVDHPNGYTTVYAHLERFTPEIEAYVKANQYKMQTFEVDLYPPANEFVLSKGDVLGKLGMSGRSFGPHLHFEIRDTKTEKPINPLLFGIDVADNKKPKIHELKVYQLNDKLETIGTKIFTTYKSKSGKYYIKGDTIRSGAWRVGFGVKAYDHMDNVSNWNGVFEMEMLEEDASVYRFKMETFGFEETRFINAHLDYEEQVTNKSYFNRCYSLPGNKLSIYSEKVNHGVIDLEKHRTKKITMLVKDLNGNTAELDFWIKRKTVNPVIDKVYNYLLPFEEESLIKNNSFYLYMPEQTLYENLYLQYHAAHENSAGVYSAVHHIHDYKVPIHDYFDIGILPVGLPEDLRDKAFIAYCDKDQKITNCGGTWKEGMLYTQIRELGDYSIMVDEVPPKVQAISFSSDMRGRSKMSFKITDNVKGARNIDQLKYRAYIDGQWILMAYDEKKDLLTYRFDNLSKGEHELRLEVEDDRGNLNLYTRTFKY